MLRGGGVIARRELGAFFLSPSGAVIGAAFLAVQGVSFWGLIAVLADPAVPAPYGAVLSSFFGGTVVYWAIVFALTSALTMRLFAEERRSGTWETLCTTGVSDAAIVCGKLTAALLTYFILWLPTVAFVVVIELFAPAGSGLEMGPVLSSYLGVALVGGALIALGALASSLTDKQMVAALGSFAVAMLVLLASELTHARLGPRADMNEFASGLVRPSAIATYLAIAATLLLATYAALAIGRRVRGEVVRRIALAVAAAVLGTGFATLASRMPVGDLTDAKVHTLEAETVATLGRVTSPVEVLVLAPTNPGLARVFAAIDSVLSRMGERQPLLTVRRLDPASSSGEVAEVAAEFGLPPEPLREGGAVVFQAGTRRRLLDVTAVASFKDDPLGAVRMATFWAESAFAQAVAEITDERVHTVCVADWLGGISIGDEGESGLDWHTVAELLRRDGLTVVRIAASSDIVSADCDALAIIGPEKPASADDALAILEFAKDGSALFVAARSDTPLAQPTRGLELVLDHFGVVIAPAIVIDPERELGVANLFATSSGYGDHPITRPFGRREIETAWPAPRAVNVKGGAVLVRASERSWAESDVAAVFAGDDVAAGAGEALGSVAIAAALEQAGTRVVVFGSAETAASQFVARGLGAGHVLAARSIRWLVGRDVDIPIADKTPEHLRLIMSKTARSVTFAVCVGLVPVLWFLVFGLVTWRRRRG